MPLSDDLNTIPRLFGDAVEQLGKLVQNEVQLAKAELSQKITQAGIGAGYIGAAAVLIIPVTVMLLTAVALFLTQWGMSSPAAYLTSAGIGALLSFALIAVGLSYLKPANLKPHATLHEVKRNVATAKELAR